MTVPDGAGRASNTAALGQILFGEYVLLVHMGLHFARGHGGGNFRWDPA